jgi:hypothetical protein
MQELVLGTQRLHLGQSQLASVETKKLRKPKWDRVAREPRAA